MVPWMSDQQPAINPVNGDDVADLAKTDKVRTWAVGSTRVFYEYALDGGGTWEAPHFVSVVRSILQTEGIREFKNCLEWCSGPGFIGFALLDEGLIPHFLC